MGIFINLTEEEVFDMYDQLIEEGLSEDDAFTEIYSMECSMDEECEEDEEE